MYKIHLLSIFFCLEKLYNISYSTGLLAIISLSFDNNYIYHLHFWRVFSQYTVLRLTFFLSAFKKMFNFLLPCLISNEKSVIFISLFCVLLSSLAAFMTLSIYFLINVKCLGMICWAFQTYGFIVFINWTIFGLHYIRYYFDLPLPHFYWEYDYIYCRHCLILSHRGLRLCLVFSLFYFMLYFE